MKFVQISPEETERKILKLLDIARGVSCATIGEDGFPDLRFLNVCKRIGMKEFWFATSAFSKKILQIAKNPKGVIYGTDANEMEEFRLYGTFEVFYDLESRKIVWKDLHFVYWPYGIESIDYAVLKFTTLGGEYLEPGSYGEFGIGAGKQYPIEEAKKLIKPLK